MGGDKGHVQIYTPTHSVLVSSSVCSALPKPTKVAKLFVLLWHTTINISTLSECSNRARENLKEGGKNPYLINTFGGNFTYSTFFYCNYRFQLNK